MGSALEELVGGFYVISTEPDSQFLPVSSLYARLRSKAAGCSFISNRRTNEWQWSLSLGENGNKNIKRSSIIHLCYFWWFTLCFWCTLYSIHSLIETTDCTPRLCSQYKQLCYSSHKNCLHQKHSCCFPQHFVTLFLSIQMHWHPLAWPMTVLSLPWRPVGPLAPAADALSSHQHLKPWLRSTFLCFRSGTKTTRLCLVKKNWWGLVSYVLLNLIPTRTALM